ncbi:MAG TPA: hypothetical protein VKU60_01080, partial [Chloroflexota bacterium]|nr:hypothetical protein [Chloroflexota bacterium]
GDTSRETDHNLGRYITFYGLPQTLLWLVQVCSVNALQSKLFRKLIDFRSIDAGIALNFDGEYDNIMGKRIIENKEWLL